jgi:hypothetical protein
MEYITCLPVFLLLLFRFRSTLHHLFFSEGLKGLSKGFSMNIIKGPITLSISLTSYDSLLAWMRSNPIFLSDTSAISTTNLRQTTASTNTNRATSVHANTAMKAGGTHGESTHTHQPETTGSLR